MAYSVADQQAELATNVFGSSSVESSFIKSPIEIKSSLRPKDIADCSVDVGLVKNTFSWIPCMPLRE